MTPEEKIEYKNNLILLEKAEKEVRQKQKEAYDLRIKVGKRNTELFLKSFNK